MKPVLTIPMPRGGRFRIYFDGTPSPSDWKSLGRVIEEVAKLSSFNMTLAGVTIGCDTAEDLDELRKCVVQQWVVPPKEVPEVTEVAKEAC